MAGKFLSSAILLITPLLAAAQLQFETASVKPADQCTLQNSFDPGMIALNGDPLSSLLVEAFKVKRDQILGPSWLDSACYTVNAKMPDGATRDQLPELFHALLVERFKLATHTETRQRSGYALLVDKNGPKLKETDPDSYSAHRHAGQVTFGFGLAGQLKGAMTTASLARHLSSDLDTPVEDQTGLKGTYDIAISWARDPELEKVRPSMDTGTAASTVSATNIFDALRDSLGLKLEKRKLQVETIVIDHIERVPTSN